MKTPKLLAALTATLLVLCPLVLSPPAKAASLADTAAAVERGDGEAMAQALYDYQLTDGMDAATRRSLYAGLGAALAKAGRVSDAITAYAKALWDTPSSDVTAVEIRRAYARLLLERDPAEAEAQLAMALQAVETAGMSDGSIADIRQEYRHAKDAMILRYGVPEPPPPAPPATEPGATPEPSAPQPTASEPPRPMTTPDRPVPVKQKAEKAAFTLVNVFYATTRKNTGAKAPTAMFGGDPGPISYGRTTVSVPRERKPGELPTPSIWSFEFRPDPAKHFVLTRVDPYKNRAAFFGSVKGQIAKSQHREVLVYIHGFNQSFEIAAERTAQLAVDLNLDGAPVFYSWPSQASLFGYSADAKTAEDPKRLAELAAFLSAIATETGATRVNVVAHSMGNRYLVRALNRLATKTTKPLFDEIVFAAPDVGVDEFKKAWPNIRKTGKRLTVYASAADKALQISRQINQMARAGDASPPIALAGLQTIDTTLASGGLIGHDDFSGSALDDFRAVVWLSLSPDRRCMLTSQAGQTVWRFATGCAESDFREATLLVRAAGSVKAAKARLRAMLTKANAEETIALNRIGALLAAMAVK